MAGLKDMMPQMSRVAKTMDNVIITIYGKGGLGKTPVACKMDKPVYFAFGKSGLSGLNNVPFYPIHTWSEFKSKVKFFADPKNYEDLKADVQTLVLDEMEILYSYCEKYICDLHGVTEIGKANSGYGAWGALKTEWERTLLQVIGAGFTVVFILHEQTDDNGWASPVGDPKRFLPIMINHSEIIGHVVGNGVDENNKPIHSSLMIADDGTGFARTRNEYFKDICIKDFTAETLVKAYYDAVDAQAKAEGVKPVSKAEQDKMYETPKRKFDDVMEEVQELGEEVMAKFGREELTKIVENVLGSGNHVSDCTEQQQEAVETILDDMKRKLVE